MHKFLLISGGVIVIGGLSITGLGMSPLLLAQEDPDRRGINLEPINLQPITSDRRVALVIGNANYTMGASLRNPINDANDMAAAFEELAFHRVILATDASLSTMENALEAFYQELRQGSVGVFYYAGHGLQSEGENYLVPVDANISVEQDIRSETLALDKVLGRMEAAGNDMNVIILDACRDNPFARSWRSGQRGLAGVDAPQGLVIAYATAPGDVAADGAGRNGTYTAALLQRLGTPGEHVLTLFNRVSNDVAIATNNRQIPYMTSARVGEFAFNPTEAAVDIAPSDPLSPTPLETTPPPHRPAEPQTLVTLRHEPTMLSSNAAKALLIENDFYDRRLNPGGQGIEHRYEPQVLNDTVVVFDATTSLMWQHGGSPQPMTFQGAEWYIHQLNTDRFAGFSDWRLPTLAEAMSLMEPQAYNNYHISPRFEQQAAPFMWTSDYAEDGQIWMLYFYDGLLDTEGEAFNAWVRAVR
ncbi:MAG: DUF1566 domain-containing protein [Cyanothece sp. SIO2G6]|nr:DUF1566 domain-containing protein [Cyanothece sp. SIO2G6]